MRELELDRQAGHVDEDDYRDLRGRYEAQAVAVAPSPRRARAPHRSSAPCRSRFRAGPADSLDAPAGRPRGDGRRASRLRRRPGPPRLELLGADAARARHGGRPPGAGFPSAPGTAGGAPRPLPKEMLEGMLQAAHASLDAGRYQEAIAAYTAVLKRDPQNVNAITHLGVILAHRRPPCRGARGLRPGARHRPRLRPRALGQGRRAGNAARTTRAPWPPLSASSASPRRAPIATGPTSGSARRRSGWPRRRSRARRGLRRPPGTGAPPAKKP